MIRQLILLCLCGQSLLVFGNEFRNIDAVTEDFVNQLNSIDGSWKAGYNFPPGTPMTELQVLLGASLDRIPEANVKHADIPANFYIPKSFDARKKWKRCKSIRSIKNQGHCGSCWAVSSATTMSDRLCISSRGKFRNDISAQQVASCSPGNGCHGGWPFNALKYFVDHGVSTGGNYRSHQGCQPYLVEPCINRTANYFDWSHSSKYIRPKKCATGDYVSTPECVAKCYNHRYKKSYRKDIHKGIEVYGLYSNVTHIQYDILRYGPSTASFEVYADFMTYKSGVYEPKVSQTVGGHAVRILGWGEENGKPYWLIANQWGPEWGEKGTVKFIRGKNVAGIESSVAAVRTGRH